MSSSNRVPLLSPAAYSATEYISASSTGSGGGGGGSGGAMQPHIASMTVEPAAGSINGEEEDDDPDAQLKFPGMIVMPGRWQILFVILLGIFCALAFTVLKEPLEKRGVTSDDLLKYGSIPLVSIVFTYVHIWMALWMTFYPLEYFGICQIPGTNVGLGWQGIIPFKAEKMARMAVRLMTQRLFDVREIFARLEPQRVAAEMGAALHITLDEVITEVAQLHSPDLWALLPVRVKRELVNQAHEEAPPAIAALMRSMQEQIDDLFDIEDMVVRALVRDKPLLNNIFIACGHKELSFIRNSGAYMGGVFGIVQMTVWFFWSNQWMLPAFGFVVGTLTNWLALKAIFQPVQPHYPCGSRGPRVQGLFLQRQQEVAGVYARTIARKVLNSKNILAALIAGPMTERLFTLVHAHVKRTLDEFAGVSKPLIEIGVGAALYARIKEDICDRFLERLPPLLLSLESYTDRALQMEETIREKMAALPPEEFESLLHPVFAEDEWKLVLGGGILGLVIGYAQIHILGA